MYSKKIEHLQKSRLQLSKKKIIILDYPSSPPTLGVRNPRGLDEAAVAGLLADMNTRHSLSLYDSGTVEHDGIFLKVQRVLWLSCTV